MSNLNPECDCASKKRVQELEEELAIYTRAITRMGIKLYGGTWFPVEICKHLAQAKREIKKEESSIG